MEILTSETILKAFKNRKCKLREGVYEMNIFAIRTKDQEANTFNDIVGLLYLNDKKKWELRTWSATTDAGTYYRENPINVNGTAIIAPGQYLNCYKIGKHKDYEAVEQIGKISYIRDNNKNKKLDWLKKDKLVEEIAKTNIHHAGADSIQVDKWSAGCIVFKRIREFNVFLCYLKESVEIYKYENVFDLTLFEEGDFVILKPGLNTTSFNVELNKNSFGI
jgi:hypothetical protein